MRFIRAFTPSFILRLFQRRLTDPNAEITSEEFAEAHAQINEEIYFIKARVEVLRSHQEMLEKMIKKVSLYNK